MPQLRYAERNRNPCRTGNRLLRTEQTQRRLAESDARLPLCQLQCGRSAGQTGNRACLSLLRLPFRRGTGRNRHAAPERSPALPARSPEGFGRGDPLGKKRLFAPRDFKTYFRPEKLHGVYLPAFTFDTNTDSTYQGRLGEHYYVNVRSNGKLYANSAPVISISREPISSFSTTWR